MQGAVSQLIHVRDRQGQLAEQAANGVYSDEQRSALQLEANALRDEYKRIVETADFNGAKLLNGDQKYIRIQCGNGVEGSIAFEALDLSKEKWAGSFEGLLSGGDTAPGAQQHTFSETMRKHAPKEPLLSHGISITFRPP